MGYEVTLKIVDVSRHKDRDGKQWGRVLGSVELGKLFPGAFYELHGDSKPAKAGVYFYADDGDTQVLEDRYGDALSVMEPHKVVWALAQDQRVLIDQEGLGRGYWAYDAAIAMLNAIQAHGDSFDSVVVMGFGH